MAGLGQLVAGIAHEINNPVGFIAGNIAPVKRYATDLLELINLYQAEYATPSKTIQTFTEKIDLAFLSQDFIRLLRDVRLNKVPVHPAFGYAQPRFQLCIFGTLFLSDSLSSMQIGSKRIATIVEALRTFSQLNESEKNLPISTLD